MPCRSFFSADTPRPWGSDFSRLFTRFSIQSHPLEQGAVYRLSLPFLWLTFDGQCIFKCMQNLVLEDGPLPRFPPARFPPFYCLDRGHRCSISPSWTTTPREDTRFCSYHTEFFLRAVSFFFAFFFSHLWGGPVSRQILCVYKLCVTLFFLRSFVLSCFCPFRAGFGTRPQTPRCGFSPPRTDVLLFSLCQWNRKTLFPTLTLGDPRLSPCFCAPKKRCEFGFCICSRPL